MAKLEYGEGITPIIGHRGNAIFSQWKGIPTVRQREFFHDYAWQSNPAADHRNETDILVKSWQNDLTSGQKADWQTYADYLETLPTNYTKIIGWKQYGGSMSAMDAFILTNSLRFSIGQTDILSDAPYEQPDPPAIDSTTAGYFYAPDLHLTAGGGTVEKGGTSNFARLWVRGKRYAHLQLVQVCDLDIGFSFQISELNYAKGGTLPIQREIFELQMDIVNTFGRFSAPSEIHEVQPYDTVILGLWDSRLWDALVWGNF